MSLVEVDHLERRFGAIRAVDDVSFGIEAGEIYGFIGPNGAGKSTTMRILATLDLPSAGDCRVNGRSTVDDADAVRRMIGYMPDYYGAYPHMTVFEYLDFFARAHGLAPAARRRAVAEVMEFCQLEGLREKAVTGLSKGMKQRLCLGRCIIHDPQVLILDEPAAGLDPRARIEFRDLLRVLAQQGRAVFVSSHILAELETLCDGVAIIEQGRIVAEGKVKQIKQQLREKKQQQVAAGDGDGHVLELRLAEEHPRAEAILAEQPGCSEIRIDQTQIALRYHGGDAELAALLRRLLAAELAVCHFATRDDNLEDVFMHLTEGKVQ
ncbi:MAG: ABC transporter ATP-binding protein [Planctomycetota bacterium]